MQLISRLVWSLVGLLAWLRAVVSANGELEIGLVFPRDNQTYAPTKRFPVVFAIRNPKPSKHLRLSFEWDIFRGADYIDGPFDERLNNPNYTSDPYFVYGFTTAEIEGPYKVLSRVSWLHCDWEKPNTYDDIEYDFMLNETRIDISFDIKKGAQDVDLVAATANNETCSTETGFTITVSDETHNITDVWGGVTTDICAMMASPSPTPTAKACQVQVDTATAASMSASLMAKLCDFRPEDLKPDDCPEEENSVQKLAVAGVASFAAALGVIGFLLVA
ncbi:hypothetical protein VTH82DRAFT_5377 [Thermothelomyces myriococcoides]